MNRSGECFGTVGGTQDRDSSRARVLDSETERRLLEELASCRAVLELVDAELAREAQAVDRSTESSARTAHGVPQVPSVRRRYEELRSELALANIRLVAMLAKGFRNRGLSTADLLQEGFCGLLEAIDRFDLAHETRLGTYASWWVRQSMQRAVAAGAYPVRLTPRNIRQLLKSRLTDRQPTPPGSRIDEASADTLRHLHVATRPTAAIDSWRDGGSPFHTHALVVDPRETNAREEDDEMLGALLENLPDREREVLTLRFGLGGSSAMSLSEIGSVLSVSKERVRQIQEKALGRLRDVLSDDV